MAERKKGAGKVEAQTVLVTGPAKVSWGDAAAGTPEPNEQGVPPADHRVVREHVWRSAEGQEVPYQSVAGTASELSQATTMLLGFGASRYGPLLNTAPGAASEGGP